MAPKSVMAAEQLPLVACEDIGASEILALMAEQPEHLKAWFGVQERRPLSALLATAVISALLAVAALVAAAHVGHARGGKFAIRPAHDVSAKEALAEATHHSITLATAKVTNKTAPQMKLNSTSFTASITSSSSGGSKGSTTAAFTNEPRTAKASRTLTTTSKHTSTEAVMPEVGILPFISLHALPEGWKRIL